MHGKNIPQSQEALQSVPVTGEAHSQEKYLPDCRHMYKEPEHSAAWHS